MNAHLLLICAGFMVQNLILFQKGKYINLSTVKQDIKKQSRISQFPWHSKPLQHQIPSPQTDSIWTRAARSAAETQPKGSDSFNETSVATNNQRTESTTYIFIRRSLGCSEDQWMPE